MARSRQIEWSPNLTNSHHWPLLPFLGHLQPQIARLFHNPPSSDCGSRRRVGATIVGPPPPPGFNAAHGRPLGHPWNNCGKLTVEADRVREADPVPLVLLLRPYYFQLLLPMPLPCKRRTCIALHKGASKEG